MTCEQTIIKRAAKEQETKASLLIQQLTEDRTKNIDEINRFSRELQEKTKLCEEYAQEIADEKGELLVTKRKYDLSLRVSKDKSFLSL